MLLDFKIDEKDDKPKLLEVNPRFWGTTWLSISAGYNYPYYLLQHALRKSMEIPDNYAVSLMCRWPIHELATIFEKPRSISTIRKKVGEFFSLFRYNNCVYDIIPGNIRPAMMMVLNGFIESIRKT